MNAHPLQGLGEANKRRILRFIRRYQEDNEFSPSRAEIAAGVRLSVTAVTQHMQELVAQDRLWVGRGPRMIRVKDEEGASDG